MINRISSACRGAVFTSEKLPDRLWAHTVSKSVATEAVSPGQSGWQVKLTIHLHLVPRWRMSYTSTPTYAFMACKGRIILHTAAVPTLQTES